MSETRAEQVYESIEVELMAATAPGFDNDGWKDLVVEKLEKALTAARAEGRQEILESEAVKGMRNKLETLNKWFSSQNVISEEETSLSGLRSVIAAFDKLRAGGKS